MVPNLVPRLFVRGSKDPGRSWSRVTQILRDKLKKHRGSGGRVVRLLRLENCNLCAQFLTLKFKFATRNHERIRIYCYTSTQLPLLKKLVLGYNNQMSSWIIFQWTTKPRTLCCKNTI